MMTLIRLVVARLVFCSALSVVGIIGLLGNGVYAAPESWPSIVSGLDGWMGLKIQRGVPCPNCYSIVFPDTFGLRNKDELGILLDLPGKKADIVFDLDGSLSADKNVLDQLLRLALDKKYVPAGKIILMPEKYDIFLGLETSELIVGTHVIPLLRSYREIDALVAEVDSKKVASDICYWSAGQQDFIPVNELIESIQARGYQKFAEVISIECRREKELMKKHGEQFEG